MTTKRKPRVNKLVATVIEYIRIKAEYERRCFYKDLEQAVKRHDNDVQILKHSELLDIINRYPLHRVDLLRSGDLDSDVRRRVLMSMKNKDYQPDDDDSDDTE